MSTPTPENLPGADHADTVADSDGLVADVPAGGAGADSGAVAATEIDPDDDARVQNVSSQNDLPGVGTRAADGGMERGTDDARGGHGSTSRHHEDTGDGSTPAGDAPEPHVDADDPIAKYQPGVGRDSAASSRIAQNLPDPDGDRPER
ncbi:hypothetical protein NS220_11485 [Microbacterium testaceum]|uniref:Uncharacterized protein n=1 Tax=Microbacterium testaceum TaxID=2033 RepID=A0A147EWH4_MICTE|nr:hypothetical protein [Microbacterium testaceum]KTR93706.1 hypothetical protein NS220_11485 [Microbacterium testaceum]